MNIYILYEYNEELLIVWTTYQPFRRSWVKSYSTTATDTWSRPQHDDGSHVILAVPEHGLRKADAPDHLGLSRQGHVGVDLRHQSQKRHRPHAKKPGHISASAESDGRRKAKGVRRKERRSAKG